MFPNIKIKPSEQSVNIKTKKMITDSYEELDINAHNIDANVIIDERSLSGIRLEEINFTNLVSDEKYLIDPYVDSAIKLLFENKNILTKECGPVKFSGVHKERIEKILTYFLSDEEVKGNIDYFMKTDIIPGGILTGLGRGLVRGVCLYQVEPESGEHNLKLILVDIYHLFIPSGKDYSSHYTKNRLHNKELSQHYGSMFTNS